MKKNWIYFLCMALPLGLGLTACDNNDDPDGPGTDPIPTQTLGAYVINTGNWGANNGSLQWYDTQAETISGDIYEAQNGKGIGDIEDLCVYGSKLYAIGSISSKIDILDRNGKLLKSLPMTNEEGKPIEPRRAVGAEGCVFFTAYDGTVSKLDTLTQTVTAKVEVGAYPEALAYTDGKLYINLSGYGKGNQVAVVNTATMTKTKDIEVKLNPSYQCLRGDDGAIYVVSFGNYAGKPGLAESDYIYQTLQRIDPATDQVEDLCKATYIANKGNKMYILYAEYYLPETRGCFVYDLETKEEKTFVDISDIPSPNGIAVDPVTEDVYIINQPYGALCELYIYGSNGTFKKKVETGIYTTNVRFVTE